MYVVTQSDAPVQEFSPRIAVVNQKVVRRSILLRSMIIARIKKEKSRPVWKRRQVRAHEALPKFQNEYRSPCLK